MRHISRVINVAALAAVVAAVPALADAERGWSVCGGTAFATCAAVDLRIVGDAVTLKLWNLSGFNGSLNNTVLNAIGFTNIGTAQAIPGSLTMSGPVRAGNTPARWTLRNDFTTLPGIFLDILTGVPGNNGMNNGINDACATSVPANLQLWENPCRTPTGPSDPGWVTLNFRIRGDWTLDGTYATIHGLNGRRSTDCITGGPNMNCVSVVPEPITIALLGTGLAGMGGFGFLRRRKNKGHDIES